MVTWMTWPLDDRFPVVRSLYKHIQVSAAEHGRSRKLFGLVSPEEKVHII